MTDVKSLIILHLTVTWVYNQNLTMPLMQDRSELSLDISNFSYAQCYLGGFSAMY